MRRNPIFNQVKVIPLQLAFRKHVVICKKAFWFLLKNRFQNKFPLFLVIAILTFEKVGVLSIEYFLAQTCFPKIIDLVKNEFL